MKGTDEVRERDRDVGPAHRSEFRAPAAPLLPASPSLISYLVWAITAALVLCFVSLIVVAPLARAHGYHSFAFVLYEMFGRVCHQIPERAFYLEGDAFAVCARCTGIYLGFAAGLLFYPLVRSLKHVATPARKWLLMAAMPALLDFALDLVGIRANTHLTRSLSGALLGAVAAFYVLPGLLDLSRKSFRHKPVYSTNPAGSSQFEGVMSNE